MFLPGRRFIGYNSVALVVVMLVIGRTGIRSARGKTVYNSNRPSNRRNKTTELLPLRFQFQKKEKSNRYQFETTLTLLLFADNGNNVRGKFSKS